MTMAPTATVKSKTKPTAKKLKAAAPKKAVAAATKALASTRSTAPGGLKRAMNSTKKVVKDHPVAVGALVGASVLVGVAASAMRHNPGLGEAVADAITSRAARAQKQLTNVTRKGLKKATSSVRRALK